MGSKYLHVIAPYGIPSYPIIKFFYDCFPEEEHKFFVMTTKRWAITHTPRLLAFMNLYYIPEVGKHFISKLQGPLKLNKLMQDADHIILHTQFCIRGKYFLPFFLKKSNLLKTIWVEYGTDLSQWRYPENKLRNKLRNFIIGYFLKKIPFVGLSLPGDEDLYEKYIGGCAKCFYTPIPILKVYQEDLEQYRSETEINKVPLVLVGGDSRPTNRHNDFFEVLSIFKDKDIAITSFMNFGLYGENGHYGRPQYRKYVHRQGKALLGSKYFTLAVPNVHRDRYFSTLNKIDIAIFSGERPSNPNLLFLLLLAGKKVYLPAETGLSQFLSENNVVTFDSNAIPTEYMELVDPIKEYDVFSKLKALFDGDCAAQLWQNMFEAIEKCVVREFE